MALTKAKKETTLKKLEDIVARSASIVFVRFRGLKVSDTTALRSTLRGVGVGYTVAKKTLMKRAFTGANVGGELPVLDGEIALAYLPSKEEGDDLTAPAREVANFAKKFKENLSIVGGIFQGVFKGAGEMQAIAAIPATPVLRGMFVNVINSPIQGFVIALNEIAKTKSAQ